MIILIIFLWYLRVTLVFGVSREKNGQVSGKISSDNQRVERTDYVAPTELGNSCWRDFYKYAAPTVLGEDSVKSNVVKNRCAAKEPFAEDADYNLIAKNSL